MVLVINRPMININVINYSPMINHQCDQSSYDQSPGDQLSYDQQSYDHCSRIYA